MSDKELDELISAYLANLARNESEEPNETGLTPPEVGEGKKKLSHDEKLLSAITGRTSALTPEEAQAEEDALTEDDFDYWVRLALMARSAGKIQKDPSGQNIEHPTTRVFRIGSLAGAWARKGVWRAAVELRPARGRGAAMQASTVLARK